MGTGSVGEVKVSKGTPCMAAEVASVANSAPPKRPSMDVPIGTESSSIVGRYIEIGRGSSQKTKWGRGGRRYEDQSKLFFLENKETKSVWQIGE